MVVSARDFSESPRALLLPAAYTEQGLSFVPAAWTEVAFTNNVIRNARYDSFQIRSYSHFALAAGPRSLASVFYGAYLLSGPEDGLSEPGSERAPWLMNAIQFEYGITAQHRFGGWTVLGEYSRRSSHPLRQIFEDPAADILRVGVAPPPWVGGPLTVESVARVGWVELWDYWDIDTIPDPRVLYTVNVAVQADYQLPVSAIPISLFGVLLWDPFLLRSGGVDGDIELDFGVGLGAPSRRVELYYNYYQSSNTEQGLDEAIPVVLIGYGIRFVAAL